MKYIIWLFFLPFCLLSDLVAQNIEVEGNVSGHWDVDTVFVTGDIHVVPEQSLTIGQGTQVIFQGFYGLYVKGDTLQAIGTAEYPVVFSVADTTGLHDIYDPQGAWKGVFVTGSPGDRLAKGPVVLLEHVRIAYAKAPHGEETLHGGGLYIRDEGTYLFSHTTFFSNRSYLNGGGVYYENASPVFTDCVFMHNRAGHPPTEEEQYGYGGGVYGRLGQGEIVNNRFYDNRATGLGGGLSLDSCNTKVTNNLFEDNNAPLGGGAGITRSNFIAPNSFSGNVLNSNYAEFFGGGIALLTFRGNLFNNTIVNNYASMGGGLYCNEGAIPLVANTIFWGNSASSADNAQIFLWDAASQPDLIYCNLEGGMDGVGGAPFNGAFLECVDENPGFTGDEDHPFGLTSNSPCIMAGDPEFVDPAPWLLNDFAGNPRIQNDRIDIGAYEYQGTVTFVDDPFMESDSCLTIYPNPSCGEATLRFVLEEPSSVRLQLFDIQGKNLSCFPETAIPAGDHQLSLHELLPNGYELSAGLYWVVLHASGQQDVSPLMIQR